MSGFRVVLDTCVHGPYRQSGSAVNPNVTEERAAARIRDMNHAFEDAMVVGWEPLEGCIVGLPDPDDRHVVAAAVRGNAAAIVTDDDKHFPDDVLEPWGLHAVTADEFLLDALDLSKSGMLSCLIEMVEKRNHPPVSVEDILASLLRAGAGEFAREVLSILNDG
ncbi:PIN domain-containing protein [Mycobacterium haemophilum]|uniref:PIN domain-containing protein n=1 Tax=Mycobacterium haemophilum TaxID=29311 RepID=UPI00069AFAA7|nr:PIN domain-containing protein [Mycobacterium haemophilum]